MRHELLPAPPRTTDYGWRPPTTYVDVLFLVVTFFIIVTAFRDTERQMDVTLQAATSARNSVGPATQIVITVRPNGAVYMGERLITLEALGPPSSNSPRQYPDESVLIRGDQASQLGTIVKVMDAAYNAGLKNVYLATVRPKSEM